MGMLRNAFVEAFSRLWNKLGFSWIAALVAAVNPVFFWMVFQVLWILTGHLPKNEGEMAFFVVAWVVSSLVVHVFPTSYAALEYLRGVYEMDVVYLRRFFVDYWRALKTSFWRSLQLFVVFGVLGVMIGYALVFYGSVLVHPVTKMIMLSFLMWVYVGVSLVQFVVLPMCLYNPEISLFRALHYAVRFVFLEIVMVMGIALLDVGVFFLLSLGYGFALITYYLFGLHFRLAVYKQLQHAYLRPRETQASESDVISQAWKNLLASRKEKDEEN
ncbi:MAG: hypothetical protein N2314_03035 [Brevinematales bacterium]|nr:hypothetical protein [Brevinematales bacterium]